MDMNLLLAILLPIIYIILIIEFDEAMMLFMLGFVSLPLAFNFDTVFGMTNASYNGFGLLLKYVFYFVPIFAFVKTYFTAKSSGMTDHFWGKLRRRA